MTGWVSLRLCPHGNTKKKQQTGGQRFMAEDQTNWRCDPKPKDKVQGGGITGECCRANNDTFLGSQQARLEGQNLNLNNSALFINYT